MRDSKAEFEFLDFAPRSRPDWHKSNERANHAEPTNEALGIVPYSGRVILLGYVLYIALVVGGLVWLL